MKEPLDELDMKYSNANIQKVLHFSDPNFIPPSSRRHVKIFISSNFEEFEYERNILQSTVFPDIQNYCLQYGHDVEFIDLNLGSSINPYFDSQLYEYSYCLIEQAFLCDRGIFFIGLLGEKDGIFPLPANISVQDMESMINFCQEDAKKLKLIQEWYSENNISNPFYSLEHLSTSLPYYYKKGNPERTKLDQNKWIRNHGDLCQILRDASKKAWTDGKMSYELCTKSTQMLHLEKALTLSETNPLNQCIYIGKDDFRCQSDTLKNQIKASANFIAIPKTGKVSSMLSNEKTIVENILVQEVAMRIKASFLESINRGLQSRTNVTDRLLKAIYREALIHLNHLSSVQYNSSFEHVPAESALKKIESIWKDSGPTGAIVIIGGEGSGKSTLISQVCSHVRSMPTATKTNPKFPITIAIRYVALTPHSINASSILRSLCLHLHYAFLANKVPKEKPKISIYDTYNLAELKTKFSDLLKSLSALKGEVGHIYIIIEDLHHLYKPGSRMTPLIPWIPDPLPPEIRILLTMKCQSSSGLTVLLADELKAWLGPKTHIIHLDQGNGSVGLSNPITMQEIFGAAFKRAKRKQEPRWMQHSGALQNQMVMALPLHQKGSVSQVLLNGRVNPLYASLVAIFIKDWPTRFKPNTGVNSVQAIPNNVSLILAKIFEKAESRTETMSMRTVLRYMSSAHLGITEIELLDLLSCNKQLMDVYYGSSVNVNVRFPYYVWANIKQELSLLFTVKVLYGKELLFWNHKIISDIAKMYSMQKPIEKTQVHCDMANLFLETIYLAKETNTSNILPSTTIPVNFREITPQPLLYNEFQYNMRRVCELWFNLLNTGDLKLLKFHALCNFDYLMSVLHGSSLGYFYYILDRTLQRFLDYEIQTLCATLTKSVDILSRDYLQLACEIIGRLRNVDDTISPYLDNLVIQAMEWCDSFTLPLLVPLSSWLEISTPDIYDSFSACDTTGGLAAIAPSSQHILMTTKSNQIHMYHLASHEFIRAFKGTNSPITALVIAYNSSFVACACADLNVHLWKIDKNEILNSFKPHEKEITCMILSYDDKLLFSGSKDCKICWISTQTTEIINSITAHRAPITSLIINSFCEILASGSEDKTIKIWLIEAAVLLNVLEDIAFPIQKIALSSDDIFMVVLCQEFHIQMRALTTGTFLYRLDHKTPVADLCFSMDTRFLIIGCKDYKIYLYDVHSQILNQILVAHSGPIRNILVTLNNDFILSTSQETVIIWNIRKPMKHDNVLTHKGVVSCVKIAKDGTMSVTGSEDGSVKVWNLEFSELQERLPDHMKSVTCVNFSPNGTYIVSGSRDATVNIKQLNEGSSFIRFTGHTSPITNAVFTLDEKSVISSELNDIVKVWRVDTGFTILNCSVPSRILMVTPNSYFAISGNRTNSMKIWNVEDGSLVNSITHSAEIICLGITPNSQFCATGSKDESLKIWEVATGKLTQVLVGHEDAVTCVTTSYNNQKIVSGSKDNAVMMWSVDTGNTIQTFVDHTKEVTCVAMTQDSSIIISSSLDGTLRVWSSGRGSLITLFDCHYPILNFCMSADASHIVVRLNDPHVLLMCLHNSPATDYKSHNQISVNLEEDVIGGKHLPIRMKPNRFSLYLGKNLIPKVSATTLVTDPTLGKLTPVPMYPQGVNGTINNAPLNNKNSIKTAISINTTKGPPKLLRKQDSMSKIFFQTHNPFPCSPKMSDLIPDMNMDSRDKITTAESGNAVTENSKGPLITDSNNIRLNLASKRKSAGQESIYAQAQANMFKAITCIIQ